MSIGYTNGLTKEKLEGLTMNQLKNLKKYLDEWESMEKTPENILADRKVIDEKIQELENGINEEKNKN